MPEMPFEVTLDIPAKLDRLGEYQAQLDLIQIQKQELMDAVKIPDEVQAAHEDGIRRKQAIDATTRDILESMELEKKVQLAAVVVPPEVQAVLDAILNQRAQIELVADNHRVVTLAEAEKRKAAVDAEFNQSVSDVYAGIAQRKSEIAAEFGEKIDAVNDNIAALTEEIKKDVVAAGKTFKGNCYQAVYMRGRVTWNTDMLEGMVILLPQLVKARKEGAPSVSIRKV